MRLNLGKQVLPILAVKKVELLLILKKLQYMGMNAPYG